MRAGEFSLCVMSRAQQVAGQQRPATAQHLLPPSAVGALCLALSMAESLFKHYSGLMHTTALKPFRFKK